jgi:hypothetical protein
VDVLGAYVRVSSNLYLAGLVWIRDLHMVECRSFPAPADSDEPRQLDELCRLTGHMIAKSKASVVALRVAEPGSQKAARIAARAEGAILTAAGQAGLASRCWFGAGLRTPARLPPTSTVKERTDALCSMLEDALPAAAELRAAAAAATAVVVSPTRP